MTVMIGVRDQLSAIWADDVTRSTGTRKATSSDVVVQPAHIPGASSGERPIILITDDVANRQKAEKEGTSCTSGTLKLWRPGWARSKCLLLAVRRYVEALKESSQLLDLLSTGSEEIEPTRAVSTRPVLYPDASFCVKWIMSAR